MMSEIFSLAKEFFRERTFKSYLLLFFSSFFTLLGFFAVVILPSLLYYGFDYIEFLLMLKVLASDYRQFIPLIAYLSASFFIAYLFIVGLIDAGLTGLILRIKPSPKSFLALSGNLFLLTIAIWLIWLLIFATLFLLYILIAALLPNQMPPVLGAGFFIGKITISLFLILHFLLQDLFIPQLLNGHGLKNAYRRGLALCLRRSDYLLYNYLLRLIIVTLTILLILFSLSPQGFTKFSISTELSLSTVFHNCLNCFFAFLSITAAISFLTNIFYLYLKVRLLKVIK